jgi:hypothetical protein
MSKEIPRDRRIKQKKKHGKYSKWTWNTNHAIARYWCYCIYINHIDIRTIYIYYIWLYMYIHSIYINIIIYINNICNYIYISSLKCQKIACLCVCMMYWDKSAKVVRTCQGFSGTHQQFSESTGRIKVEKDYLQHEGWQKNCPYWTAYLRSQSLVSIAEEQDPAGPWLQRQAGINNPSLSQFDW